MAKCRKINLCEERRNARKKVYPPEEKLVAAGASLGDEILPSGTRKFRLKRGEIECLSFGRMSQI